MPHGARATLFLSFLFVGNSSNIRSARHILHVIIDDLGWADAWGSPHTSTPDLESIVREGVSLDRFYATPMCAPSRASMFTGRHPASIGYYRNPSEDARLPPDCKHIPKRLRAKGFRTHLVGKWHLPWHSADQLPSGHLVGFNSFFGYLHWGMDYFTHEFPPAVHTGPVACRGYDLINSSVQSNGTHIVDSPGDSLVGTYSDELFFEEAKRIIRAHDPEQPLYLAVAFQGLHDPYQAPGGVQGAPECNSSTLSGLESEKCSNYSKMLSKVDALTGELVRELRGSLMWESSVVLIHTDNGGALPWATEPTKGGASSNFPLRGGKFTLYDGGVRVRGIVLSPLLPEERRGKTYTGLIFISDILKTILGMAGYTSEEEPGHVSEESRHVSEESGHVPESGRVTKEAQQSGHVSERLAFEDVSTTEGGGKWFFPETYNMWPALLYNLSSPRTEIILQPLNEHWKGDHCSDAWTYNPYHPHCGASLLLWPYKLIVGSPGDHRSLSAKLIERYGYHPACEQVAPMLDLRRFGIHEARLFDISRDPGETINLLGDDDGAGGTYEAIEVAKRLVDRLLLRSRGFRPPTIGSDLSVPPEEACKEVERTGSWRPWEP